MQWEIDRFIFDSAVNLLLTGKEEHLLEPKAAKLLEYFVNNPNRDISRDELIGNVWNGEIVSDNAINRVVVRLRKAFQDEDKIKRFIVTVPKVGYRFVARARVLAQTEKTSVPVVKKIVFPIFLIMLSLIAFWLIFKGGSETERAENISITPMVRLVGEQFDAAMSLNEGYLAYSQLTEQGARVYFMSDPSQVPAPVSPVEGRATGATWSFDDLRLAYIYIKGDQCEIHLVSLTAGVPKSPDVIYECPSGGAARPQFSKDGKLLFFVERQNRFEPYTVFSLNLSNGQKRKLSQPVAHGKGNFFIDLAPGSGELLLVTEPRPGQTDMFELNVAENIFRKNISFDYRIDAAIWGHRNKTIVHPTAHPSYGLLETDLDDHISKTLVSDSRRLNHPVRMNNGRDYLFTSYLHNRDIIIDGDMAGELNSSVMDYAPTISHNQNSLAFISKRTGGSKIWVRNRSPDKLYSLNLPEQGRVLYDLDWSFDDQYLLSISNKDLMIVHMASGKIVKSVALDRPTYGVGWISNDKVAYSQYEQGRWQLYSYDLPTDKTDKLDERWAFTVASPQARIFIDQNMVTMHKQSELEQFHQCAPPLSGQNLVLELDGDDFYCRAADAPEDLLFFEGTGRPIRLENRLYSKRNFSISKGRIAQSLLADGTSDIMRTTDKD